MAPEVYHAVEGKISKGYQAIQADIFSLGVILFYLNFGINPWT